MHRVRSSPKVQRSRKCIGHCQRLGKNMHGDGHLVLTDACKEIYSTHSACSHSAKHSLAANTVQAVLEVIAAKLAQWRSAPSSHGLAIASLQFASKQAIGAVGAVLPGGSTLFLSQNAKAKGTAPLLGGRCSTKHINTPCHVSHASCSERSLQ